MWTASMVQHQPRSAASVSSCEEPGTAKGTAAAVQAVSLAVHGGGQPPFQACVSTLAAEPGVAYRSQTCMMNTHKT